MRHGLPKFLLVAVSAVALVLFAGGAARAVTFDYTLGSVTVTGVTAAGATYTYPLTIVPGSSTLSYVDFEVPADIYFPAGSFGSAGTAYFTVKANGVGLSGEVYDVGIGDYGTKFGVGDPRYRVLKANIPSPPASLTVELVVKGQTLGTTKMFSASTQGAVLIKAGNGANTETFLTLTPAIVDKPLDAAPAISGVSVTPNPVTPPDCAHVTWELSVPATVTIAPADSTVAELTTTSATICLTDAGTKTYTITAKGEGVTGTSSSVSITVTANQPALIETTCKQIRKNPVSGNQTCLYLCLKTVNGVQQDIESATWFNDADCSGSNGPGVPLAIYGPDSPEKTLVCNPCEYGAAPDNPQACTANTDPSQTPFLFEQTGAVGNRWKNCDVFSFEKQDQGFAAVLGTDPWVVVNGRQVWYR